MPTPPLSALALAATLACATPAAAEEIQLPTPRGAMLRVAVHAPAPQAGPGPFPAVVLAPGQGYHMGQPALVQVAERLAARGVVAYRFDWAYFSATPQGTSSADLSAEQEDMLAVLRRARADARVDAGRVMVAGKSLGSLVAWRVFRADPRLTGVLLLTPLCTRPVEGAAPRVVAPANYPGFESEQRPVALILGDRDPGCSLPPLYAWAATAGSPWRIGVVGGDHGFEHKALPGPAADAARERSVQAVAELAAGFVVDWAAR